jgi:uncharacterized membrane-anchored protein
MNAATPGNEQMLNKVPQPTVCFRIIKTMASTVGETVADLLAVKLKLGVVLSSVLGGVKLLIAQFVQFRFRRYSPALCWLVQTTRRELFYWSVILFTLTLGTAGGDLLSQPHSAGSPGLGTVATSAAFLAVIFVLVIFRSQQANGPQRPAAA